MQTTISLEAELQYRLNSCQLSLANNPATAIPQMRHFAWFGHSNILLNHCWYLQQLQQPEQATEARRQAYMAACHAFGYVEEYEYYRALLNCFQHALFSGNAAAADEWATLLQKSLQPDQYHCTLYFLPFFRPLATIWLGNTLDLSPYRTSLDKIASTKATYYPSGTMAALQAIAADDAPAAAAALDEILIYHAKKAAKAGSFIYNAPVGFVCRTATLLCITALWRGLALKQLLTKHRDTLKLMPQDLPHRTELSPKCRFILPVDYIPDELLAPWQQQRLVT